MKINLWCIGKTDQSELQQMQEYYQKRLPKHWNFEMTVIPDIKNSKNLGADLLKKEEGKALLNKIDNGELIVLLDEKGELLTSRAFSEKLHIWMNTSIKKINFVIGGAYGFSDEVYAAATEKMSFSKMTFTHQMIRLFFVEQLYRADQILQGKPYHND